MLIEQLVDELGMRTMKNLPKAKNPKNNIASDNRASAVQLCRMHDHIKGDFFKPPFMHFSYLSTDFPFYQ